MIEQHIEQSVKKVVILLGAGSTIANADNVPEYKKPPLNKTFFTNIRTLIEKSDTDFRKRQSLLENISTYCEMRCDLDIFSEAGDDLEKVMSTIFSDVKNPLSRKESYPVFRDLLTLVHERIGETTNDITINTSKPLYRLVDCYLRNRVIPEQITIISFNYDIYVEKTLAVLARYFPYSYRTVFLFPYCYDTNLDLPTQARNPRQGWFPPINPNIKKGGIRVLKLHGSLNWYSHYPREEIDLEEMVNPNRPMKVSREKEINSTRLRYLNRKGQSEFTLPIIVPPVHNKTEIYHSNILDLWDRAREALNDADELVIYGYSCPSSDTESEDLLRIALEQNKKIQQIPIIDTNPTAISRYRQLIPSKEFHLFDDVFQFLTWRMGMAEKPMTDVNS